MKTNYGELIKEYREKKGISRAALSRCWDIPIDTLQGWELQRHEPRKREKTKIKELIDCEELVYTEEILPGFQVKLDDDGHLELAMYNRHDVTDLIFDIGCENDVYDKFMEWRNNL